MNLKNKLEHKEVTLGSWVTISHPAIIEVMASAGFEWLVVDLEHTSIDLETALNMIINIQANNCKALIRVSKNDEVIIKRVLDAGADGLIVPMINNLNDANKAVSYIHYPPVGKRGVGLYRAQGYGTSFEKYQEWLKKECVFIAQIEHIDGVENLDEILSVERLDGVIVGPYDLSASMGHPGQYDREDVKEALEKIEKKVLASSKSLGFHVIPSVSESVQEKIDKGYNFIAFSLDFFFLGDRAREEVKKLNIR